MSPRPKNIRKVDNRPTVSGFKPIAPCRRSKDTILLHFEEYEAIRLCDYEKITQQEACMSMGISRPTFSRIYTQAKHKIAQAFVEGLTILIEGGAAYTDSEWYFCPSCQLHFNNIHPGLCLDNIDCPRCHSKEIDPNNVKFHLNEQDMKTKIAIPTKESMVDSHFGHCEYYTVLTIDADNQIVSSEMIPSPQGCGCKSNIASTLQELGVGVMLAGNMGSGALHVLTLHGIQVIRGCSGNILDVANRYLQGEITDSGVGCTSHDHHHECGNHN